MAKAEGVCRTADGLLIGWRPLPFERTTDLRGAAGFGVGFRFAPMRRGSAAGRAFMRLTLPRPTGGVFPSEIDGDAPAGDALMVAVGRYLDVMEWELGLDSPALGVLFMICS